MNNVLIVGLGLIGGSYARALTKSGYDVSAIDIDHSAIAYALDNKIIKKGSTIPDKSIINSADIIVFGVYPKILIPWILENQHLFKKGAIITDVTGVKISIVSKVYEILREDVHFVASHPMAGREVYGVENSDEKIFKNANFIITPTEKSDKNAIKIIEKMANDIGFLRISHLTPKEHDEVIGFLSQLTHAIAVSLMNCRDNENFVKYTGDSFRDLTRIAMINEHLWSELFFENKDVLVSEIDNFIGELENLKSSLIDEDSEKLKKLFVTSTNRRIKYLNK